ncbi:MAG: FliM/FliN family flagellar motor switch protein [Hypericibacter sp.]
MRYFRPYSSHEIERFKADAQAVAGEWQRKWFASSRMPAVDVSVEPGNTEAARTFSELLVGDSTLYLGGDSVAFDGLAAGLLGAGPDQAESRAQHSGLMQALIREVLGDLAREILDLREDASVDARWEVHPIRFEENAGALLLRIAGLASAGQFITLVMPYAAVKRWNDRLRNPQIELARVPLAGRKDAIRDSLLRVSVEFNADVLSVSELHDLKVGDVLVLRQSISSPLRVRTNAGSSVGECYLGRVGGAKGIRLVKSQEKLVNG